MKRVRPGEERGVAAIIAMITTTLMFVMATMAIDAGSLWSTRQNLVTATDAAALAAARMFEQGTVDPCDPAQWPAAEAEGDRVLGQNHPRARHSGTDTPQGWEVVITDDDDCDDDEYLPTGHLRYDARLEANMIFAQILGFNTLDTFASTTVQWGYVTSLSGLRPFAVCDQSNAPQPAYNTTSAPWPHFALWNWLQKNEITQAQYDAYFDTNHGPAHPASQYPTRSWQNRPYLGPTQGGGVVHYILAEDNCGGPSSWRGFLDFSGNDGASDVGEWLRNGYPGWIELSPTKKCTPSAPNGWCQNKPGNNNGVQDALDYLRCPETTQTKDCFSFPIVVFNGVSGQGRNTYIHQTAFVFVVLRDHRNCHGNQSCELHVEFVKVQATGGIGRNPSGDIANPTGTQICGVDHDSVTHRCGV